ncbi:MAG: hypothetical protein EOO36_15380 [Cytophagaceae bacterium]|nr:MAG: hypothetical protein EOO36_15380 [Cytophagaceae bacterium]
MKQDIPFKPVTGVSVAIVPDEAEVSADQPATWTAYLLNSNEFGLDNVLISTDGYGTLPTGEAVRTTTLRYHFASVGPQSATPIELVDPAVFPLTNQYWVSYYIDRQIFDKKFLFVPDSIIPANLSRLDLLDGRAGVLHS